MAPQLPFIWIGHGTCSRRERTRVPNLASDSFDEKSNASALKSYAAHLKRCGRCFSSPGRERTKFRL